MKKLVVLLVVLTSLLSYALAENTTLAQALKESMGEINFKQASAEDLQVLMEEYAAAAAVFEDVVQDCLTELASRQGTNPPKTSQEISLSGLGYWDLVSLKNKINITMWLSEDWQEVTVPQGVWEIGVDIPEGHWTINATNNAYVTITYGDKLNDSKKSVSLMSKGYILETLTGKDSWMYDDGDLTYTDIDMKKGYYIEIDGGSVIFTPYTGKPSLGFK